MNTNTPSLSAPGMSDGPDLFAQAGVAPGGWLEALLVSVSNPRRIRWNSYLRACRAIPATSPIAGSTSWKAINARRHQLIDGRVRRNDPEFRAIQAVASTVTTPGRIAQMFVLSRIQRRMEREHPPTGI